MMSSIRNLTKSKLGIFVLFALLVAILASFVLADVSGVRQGITGLSANTLARVGKEEVTDRDLDSAMRQALNRLRSQNPEADYSQLADQFDAIVGGLIDERALSAFADRHGFSLSKRLVDAQIAEIPAARGLDGKFSRDALLRFLGENQLTEADLRRLIESGLHQQLVLAPLAIEARVPQGVAKAYASVLLESREGQVALIPAVLFRAGLTPTAADLQAFYTQNRQRYLIPEQRVLRYARVGPDAVANVVPTDAEIANYYKANAATYQSGAKYVISQAVVPSKAVADGIAARARGGAAFAAAAAPAGLSAEDVSVGPQTRQEYISLAGDAAATAVFRAAKGAIVGPIQTDLGWIVAKVDDIQGANNRTLEQARPEIVDKLMPAKRRAALAELVASIQDRVDDGASLPEAAAAAKVALQSTPPVTAQGTSLRDPAYKLPADLAGVIKSGFALEPGEAPDVVNTPDGGFLLVGVDQVMPAAPPPLAQIRDQVTADWIARRSSDRARQVASQIAAKVAKGAPLAQAVGQAGIKLPPPETISARRLELPQAEANAQAPLKMLFTLPQGKSRLVADPQGRGYFVVRTMKITPGDAGAAPQVVIQAQSELQRSAPDELAQQLVEAMKADVGVKRNEDLIRSTKARITGAASQ
jgi:peptidyl-prolyl cis-trans isomerase D